jgi:hypothetical protein
MSGINRHMTSRRSSFVTIQGLVSPRRAKARTTKFYDEDKRNLLVNLNVPLLLRLEPLQPLFIVQALGRCNTLQHILDTRHHAFQTAKVNVSTIVKLREDFVRIFFNLVLNVHFASFFVLLLTRQGIVQPELIGMGGLHGLPLVIVQQRIAIGNTQE